MGRYAHDYYGDSVAIGLSTRRQSRSTVISNVVGRVRASVRGLNGLIDRVPVGEFSHVGEADVLPTRLDNSRCVEGGQVSNSPLDFKQSSLTHTIQVLGFALC